MHITVERHERDFNVMIASAQGKEPFLTIKNCRCVEGRNGRFVSWPSKKLDSGKYWSFVYGSEGFGQAVLNAYDASAPKKAAPTKQATDDSDIPW